MDGKSIKLQVWDTAGQERFRTITQTYYKGAMGIVLAYDCTDESSFINVKNWVKQIEANASPNVVKILIGNKCDRADKKVDPTRGKALADENRMAFFETSAKNNINVKETFYYAAKEIKARSIPNTPNTGSIRVSNAMLQKKDPEKKGSCC